MGKQTSGVGVGVGAGAGAGAGTATATATGGWSSFFLTSGRRRMPEPMPAMQKPSNVKELGESADKFFTAQQDASRMRSSSSASSSKTMLDDECDQQITSPEEEDLAYQHDSSPSRSAGRRATMRKSSRQRKSIPFERSDGSSASTPTSIPRRLPSSSSIEIHVEGDDDENNDFDKVHAPQRSQDEQDEIEVSREMSEAFRTLTRVKAKHSAAAAAAALTSSSSSSSSSAKILDTLSAQDSARLAVGSNFNTSDTVSSPPGWWEWGTTRLKSTLSRGAASSLFADQNEPQGRRRDYGQSQGRADEAWMEKQRLEVKSIDAYVDRIVGFAGVDDEERAVVTLTAPALPPSSVTSHDSLLERILSRTLPLVETPGGYTVILFASGSDGIESGSANARTAWPGWAWCWRAWRGLGRNYRKNLKKLYIVHPTLFTKTLVRLIGTGSYFVSPKFAKKIVQCDSLDDLGQHVRLEQIEIMPEVLIHDLRVTTDKCDSGNAPSTGKSTGHEQQGVDRYEKEEEKETGSLPKVVRDCVEALQGSWGEGAAATVLLDLEGIFRASPSNALLRAARYAYSINACPNFARFVEKDPHLPAALLKDYLRRLDPPMFPAYTYRTIERCPILAGKSNDDEATIRHVREEVLTMLTPWRSVLLTYVLELAAEASQHADKSRMDASNLATVLAPNLVHGPDPLRDVGLCRVQRSSEAAPGSGNKTTLGTLLKFAIEHFYEIFDEAEYELPVLHLSEEEEGVSSSTPVEEENEAKIWNATLTRQMKSPLLMSSSPPSFVAEQSSLPSSSSAFSSLAREQSLTQLGIGEPPGRRELNEAVVEGGEEKPGPHTSTPLGSPRSRYHLSTLSGTSMFPSPPTSPLSRRSGGGRGTSIRSKSSNAAATNTMGRSSSSSILHQHQQKSRLFSPTSQTMTSLYSSPVHGAPSSTTTMTTTNTPSSANTKGNVADSESPSSPAMAAAAGGGSGVALVGANATATFATIRTPSSNRAVAKSTSSSAASSEGATSQVEDPSSEPSSPSLRAEKDRTRRKSSNNSNKSSSSGNNAKGSNGGMLSVGGEKSRRPLSEVFEEQ